jgi:hypothetical protein
MSDQYPTQPQSWGQQPPQPDPTQSWAQPPPAGPATRPPKLPFYRRGWFPLVTFIVGALVGAGSAGGGSDPQATPRTVTVTSVVYRPQPTSIQKVPAPGQATTTRPKPAVTAAPAATIEEGEWSVPAEVKPGTYRTTGGEGCYWARLKGFSGDLGDVIANGLPTGPARVTIARTDKGFTTSGCDPWRKVG